MKVEVEIEGEEDALGETEAEKDVSGEFSCHQFNVNCTQEFS